MSTCPSSAYSGTQSACALTSPTPPWKTDPHCSGISSPFYSSVPQYLIYLKSTTHLRKHPPKIPQKIPPNHADKGILRHSTPQKRPTEGQHLPHDSAGVSSSSSSKLSLGVEAESPLQRSNPKPTCSSPATDTRCSTCRQRQSTARSLG